MKKLKQSFIIWISIYPAILLVQIAFGDWLIELPLWLRSMVLTLVLVPLMVYVLVPFWTKVLELFKRK